MCRSGTERMINMEEKLKQIEDGVYKICRALVNITQFECCDYGFHEAVDMAEKYVIQYEKEHPDEEA